MVPEMTTEEEAEELRLREEAEESVISPPTTSVSTVMPMDWPTGTTTSPCTLTVCVPVRSVQCDHQAATEGNQKRGAALSERTT